MKIHRNNFAMEKLDTLKKVALPKGTTFYAKYKRVEINLLPDNLRIRRTYKRRNDNQRGR